MSLGKKENTEHLLRIPVLYIRASPSKLAARKEKVPPGVFIERLLKPSVNPDQPKAKRRKVQTGCSFPGDLPPSIPDKHLVLVIDSTHPDWARAILDYMEHGELPSDRKDAERVIRQSPMYALSDGDLYRKRPNGVKLLCISTNEGKKLLQDIHEGICGAHIGSRALVGKAFRQGFYWPTALNDATELVTTCEACQFHAKAIHQPAQALQTIPLSWPFAVWGLDILGPFPRATGGYEFLYVAIDKFTKWPEVEPVRKVTAQSAIKFLRSLVCRFGVPNRIITDNGTQFTSQAFLGYCEQMGTTVCFASVAHPRSNGQAERANAEVLRGLRTRTFDKLAKCGKRWVEELPAVLWSIRTTPNRATNETPFALVYGAEAVLPTELRYGSPRVRAYDEAEQQQLRQDDVVVAEEVRARAAVRAARYQQGLRRYHNRHVRSRELEEGDLVLRQLQSGKGLNKLSPKWEGPYRIVQVTRPGSLNGTIPHDPLGFAEKLVCMLALLPRVAVKLTPRYWARFVFR